MCLGAVQVQVFGGAEVVGIGAAAKSAIGKLNSEAAIEVLEAEGFKIIASSLGGNLDRQIQFHTGTAEVARRWLGKTRAEDVIDERTELRGFCGSNKTPLIKKAPMLGLTERIER